MRWKTLSCLVLCAGFVIVQTSLASASIKTASTCAQRDIQTAIDSAVDGDTVQVPAGTCTWTSSTVAAVTITHAITLQGSGCAVDSNGRAATPCGTVIIDNTAVDWNMTAIDVNYSGSSRVRITGFQIVLNHSTGNYGGEVRISGGTPAFRIDHCVFNGGNHTKASAIGIYGDTWGVIDHNTFLSSDGNAWKAAQISANGETSWNSALSLGSANAVYMEDNTFTQNVTQGYLAYGVVDNGPGGRLVFRYNILNNTGNIGGHGYDTDPSSAISSEIYNNTVNHTVTGNFYTAISFRGGTGVIFNNVFSATAGGWDTFINLYYYCGCTGNATCQSPRTYHTTYPGYEQPGFGPNGSGGQVSAPIYEWNNTTTVSPHMSAAGTCANESTMILANRDYFINTPRPKYAPYQYPHPLTLPSAPAAVRVIR